MTQAGNKFNRCDCDTCTGFNSCLKDPNFTVDSRGGYCTVRVADSLTVVIIHEISSVIVEVYRNTEDDAPIETLQFSKADFEHKTDDDYKD
jgi:hypothetical protein